MALSGLDSSGSQEWHKLRAANTVMIFFYIRTVHLDTIKVFYSPTNAQSDRLKSNTKIYIKIAPTRFGAVTPSSGSSLSVPAKVTIC
jgi:hypothetical protein